jgi:hypothetical protein
MLFLMRLIFWLLLIVLLLPSTHEDNRRLISSASRTVDDVKGFCGRNPDVCETVRLVTVTLLHKVQNGADMVTTWIGGRTDEGAAAKDGARLVPDRGSPQTAISQNLVPKAVWRDTLGEADRLMPWQGPSSGQPEERLPES